MTTTAEKTSLRRTAGGRLLHLAQTEVYGAQVNQYKVSLRAGETLRENIVYDLQGVPVDAAREAVASEAVHGHQINRTLVHTLLEAAGEHDAAARWATCRAIHFKRTCTADASHTDELDTWFPAACELRICPACANADSNRFAEKYGQALREVSEKHQHRGGRGVSFITLTTNLDFAVGSIQQQRQHLKTLHGWFKQLVARMGWNVQPNGIVASPEVGEEGLKWHIHALGYLPYVKNLSEAWASITGCPVVDIRRVRERASGGIEKAVRETLKYTTKVSRGNAPAGAVRRGLALEEILVRMHLVLKGARKVWSYGSLYRLENTSDESELPCCPTCAAKLYMEHQDAFRSRRDADLRNALILIQTNNFLDFDLQLGKEVVQMKLLE